MSSRYHIDGLSRIGQALWFGGQGEAAEGTEVAGSREISPINPYSCTILPRKNARTLAPFYHPLYPHTDVRVLRDFDKKFLRLPPPPATPLILLIFRVKMPHGTESCFS